MPFNGCDPVAPAGISAKNWVNRAPSWGVIAKTISYLGQFGSVVRSWLSRRSGHACPDRCTCLTEMLTHLKYARSVSVHQCSIGSRFNFDWGPVSSGDFPHVKGYSNRYYCRQCSWKCHQSGIAVGPPPSRCKRSVRWEGYSG
jgi:hypothetical protein